MEGKAKYRQQRRQNERQLPKDDIEAEEQMEGEYFDAIVNEPGRSHDDITVKVTFPIGTSLAAIAKWIKQAPPIIHLFKETNDEQTRQGSRQQPAPASDHDKVRY